MTERIRQNVIIPQVNEPLGLVDGKPVFPTTAWHQYFDGLWKRSGAFNDGLLEEIIRSFVETSENRAAIEAVTGLVRSLEALSQANADDARQAVESAVAAANAARDTLRAETESTIAAALELIETQARVARETARAEAQAELAVALEDSFARLRRVEDNLRAEVEATLASLGELARIDAAARANIARGAIGNQAQGFTASHAIRTLPAATPTNAASYTAKIQRTPFFAIAPNSDIAVNVSFQFRAPSDLFDWFFYKYTLRLEPEGGGTQTFLTAPVATRRKGEWVSGSMAGANYDRVEPFSLQYQFADADIASPSSTGRYRIAFDLEPDNTVNVACAEGWGATVTGTFAWQNIAIQAFALNDGPVGG